MAQMISPYGVIIPFQNHIQLLNKKEACLQAANKLFKYINF